MIEFPAGYTLIPRDGEKTSASLLRKAQIVAVQRLLAHPLSDLSPAMQTTLKEVRRLLGSLLRTHKPLVLDAIGQPDVMTPLLVACLGPDVTGLQANDLFHSALPPLMTYLGYTASKGIIQDSVMFQADLADVIDAVGHRHLSFDPPARGLLLDPLGVEVNLRDEQKVRLCPPRAASEHPASVQTNKPFSPLHPDLPRLELSLYDSNPLSMYELHPDKDGNAISLGDKALSQWTQMLHEALELIRITLPTWFEDAKITMRRLIPVGYLPERHLSATYREAPRVAYLTLCDNALTIAEAIVHETQHTKINLLSWSDLVAHNAHTHWTKSAVRPDLRPLWGVLLAAHAFVPVAVMHAQLAALGHRVTQNDRFPRRRAEVLGVNDFNVTTVVEHAEATPLGRQLIDDMARIHKKTMEVAPRPPPGFQEIDPDI